MKTCKKCQCEKHPSDFYADDSTCKECRKIAVKARYYAKYDEVRAYDHQRAMLPHRVAQRKRYIQSPTGKKVKAKSMMNYNERYPEKYAAKIATGNAIRAGRLVSQSCEKCGNPKSQAHHDDYSKPLSVRWLCAKHHRDYHRNLEQMKRLSNAA